MTADTVARRGGSKTGPDGPASIVVLLCGHVARAIRGPERAALDRSLSASGQEGQVIEVDDLCERPSQISGVVKRTGNQRLVVGLCGGHLEDLHAQAYARRAGFDAFALQVVDVFWGTSQTHVHTAEDAILRLRAASARARAYPGALPENHHATFADPRQSVSRRDLFTLSPIRYRVTPTIDADACAALEGCDLCAAVCPPRAINRQGESFLVDRAACTACGRCLEVCPETAVQFPGSSPAEISAEITTLLHEAQVQPVSVAFVCREIKRSDLPGWLPVNVTCVNSLPVATLIQTLAQGAEAVSLVSCSAPCGGSTSDEAAAKVDFCRRLLQSFGQDGDRVVLLDRSNLRLPPEPVGVKAIPLNRAFETHGKGAAGVSIGQLAARAGAKTAVFEHDASPLGLLFFDEDACTVCATCAVACPTGALQDEREGDRIEITFDPGLCSGCGRCVAACPERSAEAIRCLRSVDLARLKAGRGRVAGAVDVKCSKCEASLGSRRVLDRVKALLGDDHAGSPIDRLCSSCRNFRFDLALASRGTPNSHKSVK